MTDPASPAVPDFSTWPARWRAIRILLGWAAIALATYLIANSLSKLSGTALWLPKEWRNTISLFSIPIGMGVFQLTQLHVKVTRHWGERTSRSTLGEAILLGLAILMGLFALFALICYMQLRGLTVRNWDMRQWYEDDLKLQLKQHRDIRQAEAEVADLQKRNPVQAMLPTNIPAAENQKLEPNAGDPNSLPADWGGVPEFVDLGRQEIYLPLWFPNQEQAYLNQLAADSGEDGMTHALKHEPDRVIDWLGSTWRPALNLTSALFVLLHTATIIFFAASFSYSYGSIEGMIDIIRG